MPAIVRIPGPRGRIRNVAPVENRTYRGRVYHSAAEAKKAFELDLLKKAGVIKDWWPQCEFKLVVNDQLICKMIVDFKVLEPNLNVHWIEVKGIESEVWIIKRKLLLALYPKLDYRVCKV